MGKKPSRPSWVGAGGGCYLLGREGGGGLVGGGGRNFPKSRQSLFKDCGREGGGFGFHDKCEKRCGRKSGSRLSGRVVGELVLRFFNKPTLTSFLFFILFCLVVLLYKYIHYCTIHIYNI